MTASTSSGPRVVTRCRPPGARSMRSTRVSFHKAHAVALDLDGEVLAQVLLEAAQGQIAAQDQGGVRRPGR